MNSKGDTSDESPLLIVARAFARITVDAYAIRASECIADATERLRNGVFDAGARLLVASARRGKSTEDKPPPIVIYMSSLAPKDESK